METIKTICDFISGLGYAFMMPLMVLVLGLILGVKLKETLKSALTVGVGFIGMGIAIGWLVGFLGPAAKALVAKTGVELGAIDVGWAVTAAISFGTSVGVLALPVALGVNLLMLNFGWTKTFNTDIWNFWHYAFTGSLVYFASGGSVIIGLVAVIIHCVYSLVIADLTAKKFQEFFKTPGISMPQGWLTTSVPIIWILNWIVDKIPGLRDINWKPDFITKKFGIIGQPLFLGTLFGLVIGLLAYGFGKAALILTLQMDALMLLVPLIIPIFKEGLDPITEASGQFMAKHFKGKESYAVMDFGVLMGHPNNMAAGLLLIPITLLLFFILPGNNTLPFADLVITAFFVAMIPPLTNGNFFRSILYGIVIMVIVVATANSLAPSITQIGKDVGYEIPGGATMITNLASGNWVAWALNTVATLIK